MKEYGKELILDLHDCDSNLFTRNHIKTYFITLCKMMKMEKCDMHFWDDVGVIEENKQTNPKTKGTSAIQFIITSNVTIHTLDELKKVFINIFSCEDFDSDKAANFTKAWFGGKIVSRTEVKRL